MHRDQYVILIAFPQQQWLRERASMLRYTYIGCLFLFCFHTESKIMATQASAVPLTMSELQLIVAELG